MFTTIIRRLFALIPVGFGIVAIVASLIYVVPGDPADVLLGPYATVKEKTEFRHDLGLDKPFHVQIGNYYKKLFKGDLGTSLIYNKPVSSLITERLGATVELAFISLIVAIILAVPLGIISAVRANTTTDYIAMTFALIGVAIPNFWLGPMLVLLFAEYLGWLPVSERMGFSSYILPAITLGTALAASLSRITRNSILDNLKEDYVRTARAKGNSESVVISKHVLRNSSLALVTVIGLQFGVLLTGAIITERIFDWPGLGSLILDGINNRDFPLVQGCVLMFSASYLIVNLLTDLCYTMIDPRIRVK